jgi:hypothetical protein
MQSFSLFVSLNGGENGSLVGCSDVVSRLKYTRDILESLSGGRGNAVLAVKK